MVKSELIQIKTETIISWAITRLTEHSYSPRLEQETFFLMPGFHYEAERWGVQFVIDPKSFAERHSPFFRGSPVKTKQSKANEADVSSCSKNCKASRSPSLPGFDGGGGVEKTELGREWFVPKYKSSPNSAKRQEEKRPILPARQGSITLSP